MHLTPEQRAIGKDNYHEVVGSLDSRRDFLKKAIAATAVPGVSLGAMYFDYGSGESMKKDPLRVGVIGTGDEGNVLIGAMNPDYVQVVAIADIRPYSIYRAFHGDWFSPGALAGRPGLMKKYGWKTEEEARNNVEVYTNGYEELLDNKDIEAVIIALPLHLHDQAAIKAMRKGKHVLTEKLMAHSVHQCKEMGRVAQQTNKLLATGHQRHYSILYHNAVDMIQQGLLGDLHHIRAQWHRGNLPGKDSWQPPLPLAPGLDDAAFEDALRQVVGLPRDEKATERLDASERLKLEAEMIKAYERGIKQAKSGHDPKSLEYRQTHKILDNIKSWTRQRDTATNNRDIEMWTNRVTQAYHSLADMFVQAEDFGYEERKLEDGKGTRISPLEELIRWRLWNRTGGGLMVELGSHQLDAAGIFITADSENGEKVKPLSVQAVGCRSLFPYDRDVDDHVYCMFEYPGKGYYDEKQPDKVADPNKRIVVTYSSINGNGYGGHGEIVFGTKNTLMLEHEQEVLLWPGSSITRVEVKKKDGAVALDTTESGPTQAAALSKAAEGPVSRGYTEEIEHWAWCIRNPDPRNQPKCGPAVALADATIALTANLAMAKNQRIEFDPKWFKIDSDATPEGIEPKKADDLG